MPKERNCESRERSDLLLLTMCCLLTMSGTVVTLSSNSLTLRQREEWGEEGEGVGGDSGKREE